MSLLEAPLRLYGPGSYALTDVKEISGTERYLKIAEKKGICQSDEVMEDCLARKYIEAGEKECNCTPYWLRDYSKNVRTDCYPRNNLKNNKIFFYFFHRKVFVLHLVWSVMEI